VNRILGTGGGRGTSWRFVLTLVTLRPFKRIVKHRNVTTLFADHRNLVTATKVAT
jgi:hypothetical protein